ncbi:three prime repair exonuclease 2-like [Contarinia nasturtii]|uniref:three prime repair exonuclease 2-like n=1 Tax=Contarinia nasturtii TaxID=265458 RepID=UPI0012D3EE0F|nr:three prime repair exonuclease 2-like [Contarinia nasturtii]
MAKIETFVFFDIETTGLWYCDPPKLTELAFVGVSREHFLAASKNEIPRPIFKLLLPINPRKLIHPESTRITGLDNFMLEHIKAFDGNTVDLLNSFLNQLNKPICMVAHNGNGFDFPLLRRQLQKLNRSFDDDILCVDSLAIFREIDKCTIVKQTALDELMNTDLQAVQNRNEKTPSKVKSFVVIPKTPYKKPNAARELFASEGNSPSTSSDANITNKTSKCSSSTRISYKLTEIYERLHERRPNIAHNAEADTIHLLQCAIALKDEFVLIADELATKFADSKFRI